MSREIIFPNKFCYFGWYLIFFNFSRNYNFLLFFWRLFWGEKIVQQHTLNDGIENNFCFYDDDEDDGDIFFNPVGELQEFMAKSLCAPPIYVFTDHGYFKELTFLKNKLNIFTICKP